MCVTSYVGDFYGKWTNPYVPIPYPIQIPVIDWTKATPPEAKWDREALDILKDVMKRLNELDAKLGLPDCEDPKKTEWIRSLEERVSRLEKHADDR